MSKIIIPYIKKLFWISNTYLRYRKKIIIVDIKINYFRLLK